LMVFFSTANGRRDSVTNTQKSEQGHMVKPAIG
jgi:hypothetical protein